MQFANKSTPVFRDNYTFSCAAHEGDLGKMRFLKDNGHELGEDEEEDIDIFRAAARNGNLVNLSWLRSNGCDFGDDPFADAGNNTRVFQWLWDTGYCMSKHTFGNVLKDSFERTDTSNQLKALQWLQGHNCDTTEDLSKMYYYSTLDHKDQICNWLVMSGVSMDQSSIEFLSKIGMEIAEYIFSEVSPFGKIEYTPEDFVYNKEIDPHYEGAYGLPSDDELFSADSPVHSDVSSISSDCSPMEEDEDVDPEQEQYLKMVADLGCVGQFLVKK